MIATLALLLTLALAAPMNAQVHQSDLRYASSIDPIPNLAAHVAWPEGRKHVPVLVIMHGFRMQANSFTPDTYARLAANAFVIGVEMRGRGASGGRPDAGGREVYDIVDAIRTVLQRYPEETDGQQIHITGYSGGGANALSCAARFPDLFNTITSFFGIADYAEWYGQASPDQRQALAEWVGDTPGKAAHAYASRAALAGITNYTGGFLRLYADHADTNVPAFHSEQVAAAMKAVGLRNFALHISRPADGIRWLHQAPNGKSPDIQAEKEWLTAIAAKRYPAWTVPPSGTLQVIGYLETKRFAIWLGDGTQEAAPIQYDIAGYTFRTPANSAWRLLVKQQPPGKKTKAVINGSAYEAVADANGNAVFTKTQ